MAKTTTPQQKKERVTKINQRKIMEPTPINLSLIVKVEYPPTIPKAGKKGQKNLPEINNTKIQIRLPTLCNSKD